MGTRPFVSPSFGGWGWGRALAPVPLPRWNSLQERSPAYPFFRKEKIQIHRRRSTCVAESFERVLLRSCFLRGGGLGGTLGIPQSGATAWRRWKGSHGSRNPPIRIYRLEALSQVCAETPCGAGRPTHAGGRKSIQTQPPTPSALKKALKNNGNPRGIPPRCAAGGASQNSAKPNS